MKSQIITHTDDGELIVQGDANWKGLRVGMFTGTGMDNLLPGPRGGTESRDKEINEVVAEILTGQPTSGFKASKYMKEGIEKEPYARMAYEVANDCVVEEVAFVRHEWMRCGSSPDGLRPAIKRVTEYKSPKETTHALYLRNPQLLVDTYFGQVQTNIWLLDYLDADICSYHPLFPNGMRLLVVNVKRDDAYIARLEAAVSTAHSQVNLLIKQLREKYPAKKEEEETV